MPRNRAEAVFLGTMMALVGTAAQVGTPEALAKRARAIGEKFADEVEALAKLVKDEEEPKG